MFIDDYGYSRASEEYEYKRNHPFDEPYCQSEEDIEDIPDYEYDALWHQETLERQIDAYLWNY